MSYGDHWSEPARCNACGQERSTHDDGYCQGRRTGKRIILSVQKEDDVDPLKGVSEKCRDCGYQICPHPCQYQRCASIRKIGFCSDACEASYKRVKAHTLERAEDGKL